MATKAELLDWMKTAPDLAVALSPGRAITLAALVRTAVQQNDFDPDVLQVAEGFLAEVNAALPPHLSGVLDRVAVPTRGFAPLSPSKN